MWFCSCVVGADVATWFFGLRKARARVTRCEFVGDCFIGLGVAGDGQGRIKVGEQVAGVVRGGLVTEEDVGYLVCEGVELLSPCEAQGTG